MERERRITEAYLGVNLAFGLVTRQEVREGHGAEYLPLRTVDSSVNSWGICIYLYAVLVIYEHESGNNLDYETVVDYFSEEFEPDGSRRLHNNGNHPEIEKFVSWLPFLSPRLSSRLTYMNWFHEYYARDISDGEFVLHPFESLSPQMIEALVLEAISPDPEKMVDLTSIQQAGY